MICIECKFKNNIKVIKKKSYSLDTWRQVVPIWVVSWHAYFKSSHGKTHLFRNDMENQLNTKSLSKVFVWVWKNHYHQSGSWQHMTFHIRWKKQFGCEQLRNVYTQKLILHQHKRSITREKPYTYPYGKSKIQYLGNFSQKGKAFNSYIKFFYCPVLLFNLHCLIHWILQDVTANTDFKPSKC